MCEVCSEEGDYINHCFVEFLLFPSLYTCNCNFTQLLGDFSTVQIDYMMIDRF